MKNLMIVESPNKCKKIQSLLGNDWIIKASMGHIRDLPVKEMGIDFDTFRPHYELNKKGKGVISGLRKLCRSVDQVWLATDPDREGEAIAWHLQQTLNLKDPYRVTFKSITGASISKAVENPGRIDTSLVQAQEGRRVLDRLVGYSVSPALSQACGNGVWLTAGRVQSVALRLVVDRELEILNFKSTQYIDVYLKFQTSKFKWKAKWLPGDLLPEVEKYWTNEAFANQVANIRSVNVTSVKKTKRVKRPPAPFITSTLQQAASVTLKISPKKCMQAAQKLFESGLITYHRTDNPNLSDEGAIEVRDWLAQNGHSQHISPTINTWIAKSSAQEGHAAITPTSISKLPEAQPDPADELLLLYQLIWQRAVACQMKSAEFDATTVCIRSNDVIQDRHMKFVAKGDLLKYSGWLSLSGDDKTEEIASDKSVIIPDLEEGQHLIAEDGVVERKQTKPPVRYTEASLIKKMESEGVGRPATYASIIDNIVHREYVRIVKRKLSATDLGLLIVRTLVNRFSFMELKYTSDVESLLDQISAGNRQYFEIVSNAYRILSTELGALNNLSNPSQTQYECPSCGKPLRLIKNKFWGCSAYPGCNYTAPNDKGKPGQVDNAYQCECGTGYLQRIKGKKSYFWGCSEYPQCDITMSDNRGKPIQNAKITSQTPQLSSEQCPTCHAGTLILRKVKQGKNIGKEFYGCSKYQKCNHFSWKST
ncbi:MAG: type I DNA topoisomerase [Candidatus Thiodiazotropha lotti]